MPPFFDEKIVAFVKKAIIDFLDNPEVEAKKK